jgi:hypothetical protein
MTSTVSSGVSQTSDGSARGAQLAGSGLAPVRCNLANQRRNRSSPCRLGTSGAAMASVPHGCLKRPSLLRRSC